MGRIGDQGGGGVSTGSSPASAAPLGALLAGILLGALTPLLLPARTPQGAQGEEGRAEPRSPEQTTSVEGFLRERFEEARRQFENGHYFSAFQIADAILVLAPDVPFLVELKRLRREALGRYMSRSVLSVRFEPAGAEGSFPFEELRGVLRIVNLSGDRVTLQRGDARSPWGTAHYRVTEAQPDGSERISEGTRVLRGGGDITLDPDEVREIELTVPIPRPRGMPVVQVLEVMGSLLPTEVRVRERAVTRGIPWQRTVQVLFPDDLDEVRRDPFAHLQLALLERDPRRLVASAWLLRKEFVEEGELASERRERTIEMLLGGLEMDLGSLQRPVIRLLEALTGEVREPSIDSWRIWRLTRKGGRGG